jgi:hypothetical protein
MSKQEKARGPVEPIIRVRKDGFLYNYNDYLARNPSCEVLTGQQAEDALAEDEARTAKLKEESEYVGVSDPNGMPSNDEVEDAVSKKTGKKSGLNLSTDTDPHVQDNAALSADASRKLPK